MLLNLEKDLKNKMPGIFLVDFNAIDKFDILYIHECLMVNKEMKQCSDLSSKCL